MGGVAPLPLAEVRAVPVVLFVAAAPLPPFAAAPLSPFAAAPLSPFTAALIYSALSLTQYGAVPRAVAACILSALACT